MLTADKSGVAVVAFRLPARGPVMLSGPGGKAALRRKALAILYYLAFEGPTRRERLADLLWDSSDPLANLRVELNAINGALKPYGIVFCDRFQDPLELPKDIQVDLNGPGPEAEILDGLDGLGEGYQEWLDWRRTRLRAAEPARFDFSATLDAVAAFIHAPHLLVVEPQPCETALPFAEALSQKIRMPLMPYGAQGEGLRYVPPPYPTDLPERVRTGRRSLWIFDRPFFGEDPDELLELRTAMPSSEISYLRLPASTWLQEYRGRLDRFGFDKAAKLFLAACGHPGYLAELLAFADSEPLPLLQKYRAAIELEIRKLTPACRAVLVGLAVRSRFINERSAELHDTFASLEELVDAQWLEYAESTWRFRSSFARSVLYRSLQEGLREAAHRQQADILEQLGKQVPALLHRMMAGDEVGHPELSAPLSSWAREIMARNLDMPGQLQDEVPNAVTVSRHENFMEAGKAYGEGVEHSGTTSALVRHGQSCKPSGVALTLPAKPVLLQITGKAHIKNSLGIGLFGDAVPLRVALDGEILATLVPDQPAGRVNGELLLPLASRFEHWFLSPGSRQMTIESQCESGIVQFDVRCYEPAETGVSVEAWALKA